MSIVRSVPNRAASSVRALVSLVALVALLVGVPVVIVRSAVLLEPSMWPGPEELSRLWSGGRPSDDLVELALTGLVALLWLRFALSVAVAVVAGIRGSAVPAVRGLGRGTQRCASSLVAAATILLSGPGGALHAADRPVAVTVVELDEVRSDAGAGSSSGGRTDRGSDGASGRARDTGAQGTRGTVACGAMADGVPIAGDRGSHLRSFGGGVLLAAGVLSIVDLRRRARLRAGTMEPQGARTPQRDRAAGLEVAMRALSPIEQLVRVDVAVRGLAGALLDAEAPSRAQLVGAVVGGDGRVDLLLSEPADLESPFEPTVTPTRWCLPASVALHVIAHLASRVPVVNPLLIHLGGTDEGELFVDLETLGLLSIEPDAATPSAVLDPVVRAVCASLGSSPFARSARIVAVGLETDAVLDHPHADVVETVDAALDLAVAAIGASIGHTADGTPTARLRARGGGGFEPVAVLVGSDVVIPSAAVSDAVSLTATSGRGLGIVTAQRFDAAPWRLQQHGDAWTLEPLGMTVRPVGIEVDEVQEVRRLLTGAALRDREPAPPGRSTQRASGADAGLVGASGPARSSEPSLPYVERPWSIVVRLLGPVSVESRSGAPAVFDKARSLELVAWLATHRERSSRTAARTALWDGDVRDATFANVVSEARRALVAAAGAGEGTDWIGRSLADSLPLDGKVVTDAELLQERLLHARRQHPADAMATLRGALQWVRGLPFSDTGYLWPDADGITSQLVLHATTAAAEMGRLCLECGDIEGLFWATGRGLSVLPGHEELVGLRMRAHAERGDLAAVRSEWESYLRALQSDWGDAEPAPKLVELRRQLLTTVRVG